MVRQRSSSKFLIQLVLIFNAVIMLYPILVMAISGFRTTREIFSDPLALPSTLNLENFARVWTETDFPRYMANSVFVTTSAIFLVLVLGTMAAYALARYEFPGNSVLYLFFLSGLMVPLRLAIIPLFIQLRAMGLINTHLGLICIYAAMSLPPTVFILTGFLRTLPSELEDSGRIDGASEAQILLRIMLPLARPALVIVSIYNLVPIWNDFFFPLIFIQSERLSTLPQGLTIFMGQYSNEWSVLFAGLTVAALPLIALYIVLSRQFIAGLTAGAIK